MDDLYRGIELNQEQTAAICRGLLDLAAIDGLHEAEIALIHEFYTSGGGEGDAIAKLAAIPFDLDATVATLKGGGEAIVEGFLISCYLLIYADGDHSEQERKRITQYGAAFGLDGIQLEKLHVKARLYLLEMLAAGLRNKAAVQDVAAEMGLPEDAIDSLNKEG